MTIDTTRPGYVVLFATAFSAVFTAAVVTLQVVAAPTIERNEAVRDQRALVQVFRLSDRADELTPEDIAAIVAKRIRDDLVVVDPESGQQFIVYRGYAEDGTLVGYAFEVSGSGFWAPIKGLLSVNPERTRTLCAVFLEHHETPGLGGRITEDAFQDEQCGGLDITPPEAGASYVSMVRKREKREANAAKGRRSVEAITGATQTSRAVVKFMNEDVERFQRAMNAYDAQRK